jgi:hypothetical protein
MCVYREGVEGGRAGGGWEEREGEGGWGGRLGGEGGRHAIHLKSNPHVIKSTLIYHKAGGSPCFSARCLKNSLLLLSIEKVY